MSLHRAMVSFVIAVSIGCVALCSANAHAASENRGTFYIASSTYGAVQNIPLRAITVVRGSGTAGAASVRCESSNGTAIAGRQYTAINTTLTWAAGQGGAQVCNVSINTAHPFAAHLTFVVKLADAIGAGLASPSQTTVTIYGNLGGGDVAVSTPTYSVGQKGGTVNVVVNRTGGSAGGASVNYATANKSAVAGSDYTATSGVLYWGNNDATSRTISIPVSNAKPFSGVKSFAFAIAGNVNVELGSTTSAIVSIKGDAAASTAASTATATAPATGEATLSWTKPTTDTDGEALTNLAGFKIFYGTNASDLTSVIEVSNPATLEYEISGLTTGTWYFAIAAYSTTNAQSAQSATVYKRI